jgi:hypothetical protein
MRTYRLRLAVLLLAAGAAGAQTATRRLADVSAEQIRLGVVSTQSAAQLAPLLRRLPPCRALDVLTPAQYAAERQAAPHNIYLLLLDRGRLAAWTPQALALAPVAPDAIGAHEVRGCYRAVGDPRTWDVELVAPDSSQFPDAIDDWLKQPVPYGGDLTTFTTWEAPLAVGVTGDDSREAVTAWLAARRAATARYMVRVLAPAEVTKSDLAEASLLLLALTPGDLAGLDEAQRSLVQAALPNSVRERGESSDLAMACGQQQTGDRLTAAVLAPSSRFLAAALRDGGELRASSLPAAASLSDLRALRRLLVVPWSRGGMMGQMAGDHAAQLADQVRAELAERSGFELTDNAAERAGIRRAIEEQGTTGVVKELPINDVDGLAMVRLEQFSATITPQSADLHCLTPAPAGNPGAEPRRPQPDDTLLGVFWRYRRCDEYGNPSPWGRRENDPQYQLDLRRWARADRQWQQSVAAWQTATTQLDCEWQAQLTLQQNIKVVAQLEICDRHGTVLASAPITVGGGSTVVEDRRLHIKGWGNRPALPTRGDTTLGATAVSDAVGKAARAAVDKLLARCLVPADGRGANAKTVATPEPPPVPAAESTVADDVVVVTVVGHASLADGELPALEAARRDAERAAIEQVMGVFVTSETRVANSVLVKDLIATHSAGFASIKAERDRKSEDGVLSLTCDVQVQTLPLRRAAVESGLVRQARVMVVVPEQQGGRAAAQPAVETALIHDFLQAGLRVVDAQRSAELRARGVDLAHLEGNHELAKVLADTYGAEVMVTGEAFSQASGEVFGLPNSAARVDLKAVDLASADVIWRNAAQGNRADQTAELASKLALETMGHRLSSEFVDHILLHLQPAHLLRRFQVVVRGFDSASTAEDFADALGAAAGTASAKLIEYHEGTAQIEIQVADDSASRLVRLIERDPSLKPFAVHVTSANGTAVEGKAEPAAASAPAAQRG